MNSQYGWASSAHQNPIGQPVRFEIAGFDATISTRLGRSGAKTSTIALIGNPHSCIAAGARHERSGDELAPIAHPESPAKDRSAGTRDQCRVTTRRYRTT